MITSSRILCVLVCVSIWHVECILVENVLPSFNIDNFENVDLTRFIISDENLKDGMIIVCTYIFIFIYQINTHIYKQLYIYIYITEPRIMRTHQFRIWEILDRIVRRLQHSELR